MAPLVPRGPGRVEVGWALAPLCPLAWPGHGPEGDHWPSVPGWEDAATAPSGRTWAPSGQGPDLLGLTPPHRVALRGANIGSPLGTCCPSRQEMGTGAEAAPGKARRPLLPPTQACSPTSAASAWPLGLGRSTACAGQTGSQLPRLAPVGCGPVAVTLQPPHLTATEPGALAPTQPPTPACPESGWRPKLSDAERGAARAGRYQLVPPQQPQLRPNAQGLLRASVSSWLAQGSKKQREEGNWSLSTPSSKQAAPGD